MVLTYIKKIRHSMFCVTDVYLREKVPRAGAFSHLGPVTWNTLPYSVRHAQTQSQFKTQLKTTLFRAVYEPDS